MTTNKRTMTGEEMKAEVLAKIAQFSEPNKPLAERMHQLIMKADATLHPRLWYGMPGYAKTKDSAVLVFFREDEYMTFGLSEHASFATNSNSGTLLMPSAWFFTELDQATEDVIVRIVKNATT